MGFSLGGSKSRTKSSTETSINQMPWAPQADALSSQYRQLGGLFDYTTGAMQGMAPYASQMQRDVYTGAMPYWKQMMAGGPYSDMGLSTQLSSSLQESLGSPTAMQDINAMIMGGEGNTYADAMKAKYIQDADEAMKSVLANLDSRAAASEMSGGARHGIAQGRSIGDITKNLQSNLAQTGYETFDKDLQRKLEIAKQADLGTLGRQQMMSDMLGNQAATMQSGMGFSPQMQNLGMGQFAPYMMPWQVSPYYAQGLSIDPTLLQSGESITTSKGKKGGFGLGL